MESSKWTIYCHIHIESGRQYVGLTKKRMLQRWNEHVYNACKRGMGRRCAHFWNAIRKYGKDAFSHEILETCNTLEAANLAEEKWIEFYDARNPEKGFNLAKGGKYLPNPERKNPWRDPNYVWNDPEYRRKHGEKMRTIVNDPIVKAKISATLSEVFSRPEWLEWREKIRLQQIGKPCSQATRLALSKATSAFRREVDGYVSCGKHGLVPFTECYETYVRNTGHILYRCKRCIANRTKARYRKTHPKCHSFIEQ